MNGEGTDPRLYLCFGTSVDFIQFDSALGAISLCFTSPEVLLMKINYMKHYISTGGSLSKKHFKSHYAGDSERDVCIVAIGLTWEGFSYHSGPQGTASVAIWNLE